MSNMSDGQVHDDMFDVEKEAARSGTGVVDDPFPVWAELLEQAPVHRGTVAECMGMPVEQQGLYIPGKEYFSVFGFGAISEVYTRKDDFGSGFYNEIGVTTMLGDMILAMDGLRHRRYRNVVQEFFQPDAASDWWRERVIAGLVDELVGAFEKDESVDLNSQLCAQLPMYTVTAGFGLSPQEGIEFRRHIQKGNDHDAPPAVRMAEFDAAIAIAEDVIRQRQKDPQDDMISKLAFAELEEEDGSKRRLTVREICDFCRLIVFAGGGTTWRQLGITLFCLLNDREQFEAVRADRSLISRTILESARWCPNDPMFPRQAIRDTELAGVAIPKGAVLHLCLAAANRDPSRWDDPDRFDVHRPVQRSLAFAAGHHSCLGQHVSREEMSTAINALMDRFPNMRWDPSAEPAKLTGGLLARGPGPLRVLLH
ncbi:MAG: cytochrome P450 [Novosphingobium sp.]|nr:cytochrome P450 [Novosphingobium sp.]